MHGERTCSVGVAFFALSKAIIREQRRDSVNTRLLIAGCLTLMSAGLVSGQAGQATRPPSSTSTPVTRQQTTASAPASTAKPAASDSSAQRALINQYCVTCHNERLKTGDLMLD